MFPPSSSRSTKKISPAGPAWRRGKEIAIYASLRGSALAVWPAVAPTPDFMDDFRAFLGGEHSVLLRQSLCKEVLQLPSPHIFFFTNVLFFWQKNEQQPQTTWASLQAISPRGKLGGGRSASKGGRRSEFVKKVGYAIRLAQLSSCDYYYSGKFCISLSSFWLLVSVCLTCLPPKQQPRKLSEEKATWKTRILMLVEGFFSPPGAVPKQTALRQQKG